jgi:hypothetical protein
VHDRQRDGVVTSVSHPSSALAVQCAKPVAQAFGGTTHAPAAHPMPIVVPRCGSAVQSWPHAPQFLGSLDVSPHASIRTSGSPSVFSPASASPFASSDRASAGEERSTTGPSATLGVPPSSGPKARSSTPHPAAPKKTKTKLATWIDRERIKTYGPTLPRIECGVDATPRPSA